MIYIRIAIAIGVALVIGAFMYEVTKPITNQAFAAAVPCSLSVGLDIHDPPGQSAYIGSLDCQGLAGNMPAETIHLTLHDITTGSITNQNVQIPPEGFYNSPVPLVPGHSYTVDGTYDGNKCCQPASATTVSATVSGTAPESINVPASTGSTQESNNTGNSEESNNTQQ